ncbi:MAG: protein kinase [Actinomycetota bacterium]|nr:protein kinase [Actinomycetota bacterium]
MAGGERIGSLVGSYRIDSLVGRGGMGVVYRAQHTRLKRLAALKVLAPEVADEPDFRERFERESELAAAMDHPNIIPIYDAGEADGTLYIAMRFVEGTDLRALLEGVGPLTASRAVDLLEPVASALDGAHRRGLVHRDVKPGNVMVEQRGGEADEHVFLTDFGLVKRVDAPGGLTRTGYFVGTVDYAAPEQFRGEPLDGRTDQYALGCLLYHCLAGHPPFPRDDHAATMFAHLSEPPPSLGEVAGGSVGLDPVIRRAMAKSRDDRYATCLDFIRAARQAFSDAAGRSTEPLLVLPRPTPPMPPPGAIPLSGASMPPGFAEPSARSAARRPTLPLTPIERPSRARRRGLLAAATVVLVAAVVAVVLAIGSRGKSTPPHTSPSSQGNSGLARSTFVSSLKPQGPPPVVAATRISGFLFTHSLIYQPSFQAATTAYALPGNFTTFSSQLGWEPDVNNLSSQCPSVTFKVLANDGSTSLQLLDQTVYPGRGDHVSVPLGNARHIELQTIFPSDCSGTAVWGNPALLGSGPALQDAGQPEVTPGRTGYLADLDPALAQFEGPPPGVAAEDLGDQAFPESLTYRPEGAGTATYELGGSYARFTVTLGWLPDANNLSSQCPAVAFQVLGDITDSLFNVQVSPGHPVPESVSVKNVGEIRLVTTFPSDCSGTAVWGSAKVIGTG